MGTKVAQKTPKVRPSSDKYRLVEKGDRALES